MIIGFAGGGENVRRRSAVPITRSLERLAGFLKENRVDYLLIGAVALSLWGIPRMTRDIDFLIQADEAGLEELRNQARKKGLKTDSRWRRWNPLLREIQIRLRSGSLAVDFMRPRDHHDQKAFERGRRYKLKGTYYNVIAPEDFILQKLKVGRPRDFEDAVTVAERMKGKLNQTYLKQWARQLSITDELDYVLN